MVDVVTLNAEGRTPRGKGGARALRRTGRVPGVVYGSGMEPVAVSMALDELNLEYGRGGFFSRLYALALGGETLRVLPREVQTHPVSDTPLHVDFLQLAAGARINVEVAVRFINEEESPGLRRGGVINVVRHTVELECNVDAIPEALVIDLDGLEIGDSVHISAITLPEGAVPTITDRDFTVATVAAPTVVRDEAAAEAAAAEEEEGLELDGEGAIEGEGEGAEGEEAEGGGEED
jgi:large subunit ribosomal protein L25